jgi:hypothetical protein
MQLVRPYRTQISDDGSRVTVFTAGTKTPTTEDTGSYVGGVATERFDRRFRCVRADTSRSWAREQGVGLIKPGDVLEVEIEGIGGVTQSRCRRGFSGHLN